MEIEGLVRITAVIIQLTIRQPFIHTRMAYSDADTMAACKDRPNTVIIAHLRRKQAVGGDGDFFLACYHMYVRLSVWRVEVD